MQQTNYNAPKRPVGQSGLRLSNLYEPTKEEIRHEKFKLNSDFVDAVIDGRALIALKFLEQGADRNSRVRMGLVDRRSEFEANPRVGITVLQYVIQEKMFKLEDELIRDHLIELSDEGCVHISEEGNKDKVKQIKEQMSAWRRLVKELIKASSLFNAEINDTAANIDSAMEDIVEDGVQGTCIRSSDITYFLRAVLTEHYLVAYVLAECGAEINSKFYASEFHEQLSLFSYAKLLPSSRGIKLIQFLRYLFKKFHKQPEKGEDVAATSAQQSPGVTSAPSSSSPDYSPSEKRKVAVQALPVVAPAGVGIFSHRSPESYLHNVSDLQLEDFSKFIFGFYEETDQQDEELKKFIGDQNDEEEGLRKQIVEIKLQLRNGGGLSEEAIEKLGNRLEALERRMDLIGRQQGILWKEHEEKQKKRVLIDKFNRTPNLQHFYLMLKMALEEIFISCRSVGGGMVVVDAGKLGKAGTVCSLASGVFSLIPVVGDTASKITTGIGKGLQFWGEQRRINVAKHISRLSPWKEMLRTIDRVACQLTDWYEPQLRILAEPGQVQETRIDSLGRHVFASELHSPTEKMALFAVMWIREALEDASQIDPELPLDSQFVSIVTRHRAPSAFSKIIAVFGERSLNNVMTVSRIELGLSNLFTKCGMVDVATGQTYEGNGTQPEIYGYCRGTSEAAMERGLTLVVQRTGTAGMSPACTTELIAQRQALTSQQGQLNRLQAVQITAIAETPKKG